MQEAPQGAPQQPMPYVRTRTARRRPLPLPAAQGGTWPRRSAPGHGEVRGRSSTTRNRLSERCSGCGAGAQPRANGGISGPALGCGSPATILPSPPDTHRCQHVLWSRPRGSRVPEPGPAHHPLPKERSADSEWHVADSACRLSASTGGRRPLTKAPFTHPERFKARGRAGGGAGGHAGMNGIPELGEQGASGRAERGPSTWPRRRRLTQPGRAERCGHPPNQPSASAAVTPTAWSPPSPQRPLGALP